MKLLISFEVLKGYDHFKEVFISMESKRKEAGIETIYAGKEAKNENVVHVCLEVESMDGVQEFMQRNAEIQKEAGVNRESQVMIPIIE
tara:strand:+ start:462 stop:725 length:264 start_codon:yes stop_codon:yes gene_type:complete